MSASFALRSVTFLFVVLGAASLFADDLPPAAQKTDPAEAENARIQAMVEAAVKWYEFLPTPDSDVPLMPRVALRWRNATRGQKGEDLLVVWTDRGRPQALASIYPWNGAIHHELASLSRENTLIAREAGTVRWSPRTPGVTFVDVPDAPVPAETEVARLRQMKALAGQFKVTMTGWKEDDSDREEMRLLPQPVYRYDLKEARGAHPGLRDGALFAFVQGTDPEAVLVLEAFQADKDFRWQYAFARATSGGLEARLSDKLIWQARKGGGGNGPLQPQTTLTRLIGE